MAEELKPCRWCTVGTTDAYLWTVQDEDGWYQGYCNACEARGPAKRKEAEAIAAWNQRPAALGNEDALREAARLLHEALCLPNNHQRSYKLQALDAHLSAALSRIPAKATTPTPTPEDEKP